MAYFKPDFRYKRLASVTLDELVMAYKPLQASQFVNRLYCSMETAIASRANNVAQVVKEETAIDKVERAIHLDTLNSHLRRGQGGTRLIYFLSFNLLGSNKIWLSAGCHKSDCI
jgi:hypothetical protein